MTVGLIDILTDLRTGGSNRPSIAPSSPLPTPPLLSSPPPAPGSASARSRPPPSPQRGAGGLYPGRERMAGYPPSAQAGDKTEEPKCARYCRDLKRQASDGSTISKIKLKFTEGLLMAYTEFALFLLNI